MTTEQPAAGSAAASTVDSLLDRIASLDPTPGGGSVSALAGALAAALGAMVCRLTRAKAGDDAQLVPLAAALDELDAIGSALTLNVDRDAASYEGVIAAMRLPRETVEQKAARREAIEAATRVATEVPLETARLCLRAATLCLELARTGYPGAVTDAGVGVLLASAGVNGALYNVEINLSGLSDRAFAAAVIEEASALRAAAHEAWQAGDGVVRERIAG